MKKQKKLWGNAHNKKPNEIFMEFTSGKDVYASKPFDEILIPYDIKTNKAHIKMLYKQGLLTLQEYKKLDKALDKVQKLYEKGEFLINPALEDVHTNIENKVTELVGDEIGGKIHTARSRNDQVTSDMYLYLHDEVDYFLSEISNLILNLKTQSTKYSQTPCPGFTHYQPATVTSFGKILDAFKSMFERDLLKLKHLKETYNFSPLGAVTGYSTTLDIDPNITAAELGYKNIFKNSIDVITNRGEFEMTFANCLSGFLIHASMMAQTFIIFSTQQFGYIVLPDEFTTGSSVMPQKKNPDALEIIKSKSAGAIGVTTAIQSILSASFIGYNRDTQEIKYKIMSLLEDCKYIPYILSKIVRNLKVNKQKMLEETQKYFINSTEVMESLMKKSKLPMRKSKEIIEMAINESIKENSLDKITKSALEKSLKKARIYRIMELEVFLK